MHASLEEILWPNIFLLTIVGIWPLPSKSSSISRLFVYVRIIIQFVLVSFIIVMPVLYTISLTWGDVSVLADCGGIMFINALSMFKLAYVIMRRDDCQRVNRELIEFWEITKVEEERLCFEALAILAKTATTVCIILGGSDILMFIILPIINDVRYRLADNRTSIHRILPLDISYGFDYQHSPFFEILFILQILSFFCTTTSVLGNDCTVMTAILHISGQFRLLTARFEAIGNEIYSHKFGDINYNGRVILDIGWCIKHHQRVIKVAAELKDIVGPMVFGQVLTSGVVICFGGFSIMKGHTSEFEIIKFFILFMCMIFQLLLWCWPGELLIQESGAVAQNLFSKMPWFMLPNRIQRDLCFVMLRAQKESNIVSFFQVMSLRKLTEIFNTAASYMALLRSINDSS